MTTGCDVLIGVAALATATAPLLPWAKARLGPDPGQSLDAVVMAPQGTVSGLYAHPSLKPVMVLAVLQLAVLLARYCPGGRLRVPGYGYLLAAASAIICLIVAADIVFIPEPWANVLSVNSAFGVPDPWEGTPVRLDGVTLVMTWHYAAAVAMTAALALLVCALVLTGVLVLARRRSRREQHDAAMELG